jgi:hypothetical protein
MPCTHVCAGAKQRFAQLAPIQKIHGMYVCMYVRTINIVIYYGTSILGICKRAPIYRAGRARACSLVLVDRHFHEKWTYA